VANLKPRTLSPGGDPTHSTGGGHWGIPLHPPNQRPTPPRRRFVPVKIEPKVRLLSPKPYILSLTTLEPLNPHIQYSEIQTLNPCSYSKS